MVKSWALVLIIMMGIISKGQSEVQVLPITEFKAVNSKKVQVIYLSGDGGMNDFSSSLCRSFQAQGYPVAALDCKKYFWKAKTPDLFTQDISGLIAHYSKIWRSQSFIVIGYSFGADVGAFLPGRLANQCSSQIKLTVMLAPSVTTDFEIKLSDMLGENSENRKFNILKEINTEAGFPKACSFSEKEADTLKNRIENKKVKIVTLLAITDSTTTTGSLSKIYSGSSK